MIRNWVAEAYRRNRLLTITAAAHFVLFLVLIPAAAIDPVQILGISRWIKPMKFAISIAIFTATMAWLLAYLPDCGPGVRRISRVIAVSLIGEMVLITMQSARGVRSHFNDDTLFDQVVFGVMGFLIVLNTLAVIAAAWLFFRHRTSVSGAYLTGIRLGIIIFILASLEGGLMVARDSHSVGVHDGGPGLPVVNWNTGAGDLRVAHFAGMHALQGLPLLGWFLDRRGRGDARRWVAAVAAAWFLVTALLVVQAFAGRPLLAA